MDGNSAYPYNVETISSEEYETADMIDVEQLKRLVQLIDTSDVTEIEVNSVGNGTRLVLRKAKAPENGEYQMLSSPVMSQEESTSGDRTHTVTAPLVGIFHPWAKPRGNALVAVGDRIKVGQLLGTIQSLNVLNEVESSITGRIVEILVQDGQGVEYGQPLMVVDSSEET